MERNPVFSENRSAERVTEKLKAAAAQRHTNLEGFCQELQHAMAEFQIPLSDRGFRQHFSRNYRILFQANPKGYRVEVLESVLDLTAEISVNRRIHQITGLAMRKGYLLQQRLSQLFSLLETSKVERKELRQLLFDLDQAWMEFEKHYIMDLIDIEAEARQPLADAVNLELQLRQAEEEVARTREDEEAPGVGHRTSWFPGAQTTEDDACSEGIPVAGSMPSMPSISTVSQCIGTGRTSSQSESSLDVEQLAISASGDGDVERRQKMKQLLKKVCEVNACANFRGRGRPFMNYHTLETAADDFLASQATEAESSTPETQVLLAFARHVLTRFLHLRSYLFEIRGRMLEIDPQLRNNARLQNCLVAWEDAWELGSRFLRPREVQHALCSVAVQLGHLQREHETLASMVDTQEAELFLVLPRLVLLCSLAHPDASSAFTALLLPSHVQVDKVESSEVQSSEVAEKSAEWDELLEKFQNLEQNLSWKELVEKTLEGPANAEDEPMKVFLTQLEALGFELTRRRPEEWNSCCSLLLRCAASAPKEAPSTTT
eukprot:symbB.v1.2.002715.t1/scaffold148.1/size298184/4